MINIKKYIYLVVFALFGLIVLTSCGEPKEPIEEECIHDFETIDAKKATCTEVGWEEYQVCTKCGLKIDYVELPTTDHKLQKIGGKAATCTEGGWEPFEKCNRCDYTTFKEIPPLGHDIKTVEKENPDCMHAGHEEYEYCCREGCEYHTEEVILLPTKHELKEVSSDETSTTYHCDNCKEDIVVMKVGNPLNKDVNELQGLNILLVGNSYTNYNSLMKCLAGVLDGQGIYANIVKVAYGSQYLYDYINGPKGDYYYKVDEAVRANKFDVVFLQEQSTHPVDDMTDFFVSTRTLYDFFTAKGTTCIMYATWAVPDGHSQLSSLSCKDSEEMTQLLTRAYEAIAIELGITTSPVGTAFRYIYENHLDNKALLYASLSNQHPSAIGTYVAALCHYGRLYGRSVKGVNYTFNDYADDTSITWNADTHEHITDEMQREIEEAVDRALFGGSIVKEEYVVDSTEYK